MYLYEIMRGENARRFCETALKMDGAVYDIDALNRVEIFGSGLQEAGPDYCEFRIFDCQEKLMAVRRADSFVSDGQMTAAGGKDSGQNDRLHYCDIEHSSCSESFVFGGFVGSVATKLERNAPTIRLIDIINEDGLIFLGLDPQSRWTARELAAQILLKLDEGRMTDEELLAVNYKQVADYLNGEGPDADHIETRF